MYNFPVITALFLVCGAVTLRAKQLCLLGDFKSQVQYLQDNAMLSPDEIANTSQMFYDVRDTLRRRWREDILDTTQLQFEGDFDAQVQEILSFVRLTADKVDKLKHLFDDIEHALQHVAPGCHIQPFGSVVTGLGIQTSDVDCYVALPDGEEPSKNHVTRARNILLRYHRKFTKVVAITTAKVPIVKFVHIPTQRQCDISFKSPSGVQNSNLVAFLLHYDKRALPLAVLIKYWSKVHKFTGTNLLANYTLTMMVIFYLQLMNILPSVYELQKNMHSYMIDSWNTAFDDTMTSETRNTDSLYELMGGFFKCYSTFNFKEHVVSPFIGRVTNKHCFENFVSLPEEFSLYKAHVSNNVCKKLNTTSKICVQDPFEHNKNCARTVYNHLADRIISHFQFASKKFEEEKESNFLKAILTQDPNSMLPPEALANPKHISNNKVQKPHISNNKVQKPHISNHKMQTPHVKQSRLSRQTSFNKWFTEINNMSKEKRSINCSNKRTEP